MNISADPLSTLSAAWQARLSRLDKAIHASLAEGGEAPDDETTTAYRSDEGWRVEGDPLHDLCQMFDLNDADEAILTIVLAPEISLRHARLYRRFSANGRSSLLTLDTIIALIASDLDAEFQIRRRLEVDAPLMRDGLLLANGDATSTFDRVVRANPVAVRFAATGALGAPPLAGLIEAASPEAVAADPVEDLTALLDRSSQPTFIALRRARGMMLDKGAVHASAASARRGLLGLTAPVLAGSEDARGADLSRLVLFAQLSHASIFLDPQGGFAAADFAPIVGALARAGIVIIGEEPLILSLAEGLGDASVVTVPMPAPDATTRETIWRRSLAANNLSLAEEDMSRLARRFRFGATEIGQAVADAAAARLLGGEVNFDNLAGAARRGAAARMGGVAQLVETRMSLDQLVHPAAVRARIDGIVAAIRHREILQGEWGFEAASHGGRGLTVLFSGSSGVGKTATATAIATALDGRDLYRIDLASVVSKYIGETEKNLDRIFTAAEGADALLFFDEADALFGKRSEVKDAHDRYANLETAYLLQRIEAHDGVSMLATNIAKNMDAAFQRRIQYVIEFPNPEPAERAELWRRLLPADAPLSDDLDIAFLARAFPLTGGDIRSITVDAGYEAIAIEAPIGMAEIVRAVARHYVKCRRPILAREFRPYEALIDQAL